MVAEKNGIVRFYDLVSQQPIMSLSAGQVPLISADWCKTNALKVGAVASDDWLIWDMSKSRYATLKFTFKQEKKMEIMTLISIILMETSNT